MHIYQRTTPDVLIIGGGAIGVCSAYYLLQHGFSVTLVEKGELGAGSSYGNAGLIVPSHSVPLAAPGVWRQGLKWLLDPASPLYIKPRLDADLMRWMLLFLRACDPKRLPPAVDMLAALTHASRDLFRQLANLDGAAFDYAERGGLALYLGAEALDRGAEEAHLLREHGVETQVLDAAGVRRIEPNVLPAVMGGVYFPTDAHLTPHTFVREMAQRVQASGGVILTNTDVTGFRREGRGVTVVSTASGILNARQIVLASGAWSPHVARDLGIWLPIQPAKGYSLTVDRPSNAPSVPLHLSELKVVVTPMGDKLRFAGTLELAGFDTTVNERRVEGIKRGIRQYLPHIVGVEGTKAWYGLRPLSPDTLPIIGRHKAYDNLIVAAGHGMLGISLAPVTGHLVAQIAVGQSPDFDLSLVSPNRFA